MNYISKGGKLQKEFRSPAYFSPLCCGETDLGNREQCSDTH